MSYDEKINAAKRRVAQEDASEALGTATATTAAIRDGLSFSVCGLKLRRNECLRLGHDDAANHLGVALARVEEALKTLGGQA